MADNRVLIEVVSQSEGLDETNAKLQQLSQREKELIAQMDSLSKQKQQWQGSAQVVAAFDKEIENANTELKSTRKSMEDLSKATKQMPAKAVSEQATQSFRTMRREIEEQIKQMQVAGKTGTEEYQKLIEQAGRLSDIQGDVAREIKNMASDTGTFDAVLEGTQLVAGGFSVAQGAAALFGAENEDLQKAMVKLQAAIAITTGLQQIQNGLQKESAIVSGLSAWWKGVLTKAEQLSTQAKTQDTVATAANTAATGAQTVAATAGTAANIGLAGAFKLVGFAIKTIPVFGWILAGIAALITVVSLLTGRTNKQIEAQIKLNEQTKLDNDEIQRQTDKRKEANDRVMKDSENELSLMKAKGVSQNEIAKKEAEIAQKRVDFAAQEVENQRQNIDNLKDNRKKVEELEIALYKLNSAKKNKKVEVVIDGKVQEIKATEDAKKSLQGQLDNWNFKVKAAEVAIDKDEEERQKQAEQQAQEARRQAELGKRSAQALADYRVVIAQKGSDEELKAQKAALEQKLKNELSTVDITEGEKKLKRAETLKAIKDLEDNFNKQRLQDDVTNIDAQLANEKDFNLNVLNLRLARLEAQKQVDLANAKDSAAQKNIIEQNHIANVEKLYTDYYKNQAETESNTAISNINAKLAVVKAGSQQEHDLKVELLKEQAQAEIDNALLSIKNEEERAAKIKEINAKLAKDIADSDFEFKVKGIQTNAAAQELATTQSYEKGKISKQQYEKQLRDISIQSLQDEIAERKAAGQNTVDLEKELSEKRIAIAEKEAEQRKQLFSAIYSTIGEIANTFMDMNKQRLEQEMADFEHYYTTDREAAKKNKDMKLISEEEFARKQLEIKRKQAKADKEQALFNAIISTAQAVASALTTQPFWLGLVLAALAAAMGAVQISKISSQPMPKYWKGRRNGKGEYAMVGEYGPELMFIPTMSSIMPAHDTRRALAGDGKAFDRWNMPRIEPNYPQMPRVSQQLINQYYQSHRNEDRLAIDYERLGKSVAKYMKFPKQKDISINFDKSGLRVTEGNTTTKVLNAKYSANV